MPSLQRAIAGLITLMGLAFATPSLAQPEFPELTGRVVDAARIIPPAQEAELTAKLEALETQSQRQFVIATLPDLQGYDIADYGYQLGRHWGIGDEERNDGVLLLVAPNERKTRIEVGYGVEPVLTDGMSTLIVQKQMLPQFREGKFADGINVATDTIIRQLTLPPEEAQRIAQQANQTPKHEGGFPIGVLIWLAFLFFFFILPMFRGGKRRRYRGAGDTAKDIILWEVGSAIARGAMSGGRGGGGGFSSGGFGGGFSGGGGSFGGGGASGGW